MIDYNNVLTTWETDLLEIVRDESFYFIPQIKTKILTKGEVRRAINNKGIKINDFVVVDENKLIEFSDFQKQNMKISIGKKKHYLFKIT